MDKEIFIIFNKSVLFLFSPLLSYFTIFVSKLFPCKKTSLSIFLNITLFFKQIAQATLLLEVE